VIHILTSTHWGEQTRFITVMEQALRFDNFIAHDIGNRSQAQRKLGILNFQYLN
jgi:hypothetical protein